MKEVRYLLREKKCIAHVDRYTGKPREREEEMLRHVICGSLNYFYGMFLRTVILVCRVHRPYLVYLRILPHVHRHLLAKMDPSEEVSGAPSIT